MAHYRQRRPRARQATCQPVLRAQLSPGSLLKYQCGCAGNGQLDPWRNRRTNTTARLTEDQ